jgi:hypothetical protein
MQSTISDVKNSSKKDFSNWKDCLKRKLMRRVIKYLIFSIQIQQYWIYDHSYDERGIQESSAVFRRVEKTRGRNFETFSESFDICRE